MKKIVFLFAIIIAISHAPKIFAQSSIISPLGLTIAQLDSEQLVRYNKVIALNMHVNYQFIHINPIGSYQQNGKIAVSFINSLCPITYFKAQNVEYNNNDSDYYWYGNLVYEDSSSDCELGSAMLIGYKGEHFGQIQIKNKTFEIIDLSGGVQLIAQYDTFSSVGLTCGTPNTSKNSGSTGENGSPNFCNVRILFLYTASAMEADPNIHNRIKLAMKQGQQALTNSDVAPEYLNLVHVGTEDIRYGEDVYDLEKDVYQMTSFDVGGIASDVVFLKHKYKADIVILLTKPTNGGTKGVVVGIQEVDSPYAAIQVNWATNSDYVFAHELGHLLGARHQDSETAIDTNYSIAHAHQFSFTTTTGILFFKKTYVNIQRTITYGTSSPKNNGEVVLYYSNPNVDYSGVPTGLVSSPHGARNAAQHLRNVGCSVAYNYPEEPGDFSVVISPEFACPGKPSVIRSHVTGSSTGTGFYWYLYTYEWSSSSDGITYGSSIGTSPTLSIIMPSTKMFYRLKVTSPTGSVLYAYCSPRVVPSGSGWCTGKISKEEVESNSYFNTNSQLNNVYPNPSSSKIIVDVNISEMGNASISLFDFTGRFVQTLYDGQLNAGNQKMPLILPDLSNGVYFIQFRTGDCLQTTKINILR